MHIQKLTTIGLTILNFIVLTKAYKNNVCKTFKGYYIKEISSDCWYNPDLNSKIDDIVRRNNFSFENYTVTSQDGYILSLFRIPPLFGNSNNKIALLAHPATGISGNWVDKGNHSLAFILAQAGFDVFLTNFRGSFYSKGHKNLSVHSNEYWEHSFHEMGLYDIPAFTEKIENLTNTKRKIVYIGHSMGITSVLAYASMNPEKARSSIKSVISLGGVSHIKNAKTMARFIAPFQRYMMILGRFFHKMEVFSHSKSMGKSLSICYKWAPFIKLCNYALFPLLGFSPSEIKPEWVPLIFSTNPGGVSLKSFSHLGQIQNQKGRFQMYDHGPQKNLETYGTETPPLYPVEEVKVPFYLFYGSNDIMSPKSDTLKLYNALPRRSRKAMINIPKFAHLDFLYGKNVRKLVYERILQILL